MTKAPETILVNLDNNDDGCCPVEVEDNGPLDAEYGEFFDYVTATSYTRTDLLTALRDQLAAANARADAARDAALVEAADKLKSVYRVSITRVGGVDVYGSDAGSPASCYHTILALRDKPAPGVSVRAYLLRHKDTGRECIIDAKRYDPTKLDYWINPAAMASVEITPLGAIAGGGNELQTAPAVTVQEAAKIVEEYLKDNYSKLTYAQAMELDPKRRREWTAWLYADEHIRAIAGGGDE